MRKLLPVLASVLLGLVGLGVQLSGLEIPWLGYGLMLLALAILLGITVWPIARRLRFRLPVALAVNSAALKTSTRIASQRDWLEHFHRLCTSRIEMIDFKHLWKAAGESHTEPSIEFYLRVTNNTPLSVLITGVEGKVICDNEPCSLPPQWAGGGRRFPAFASGNVSIVQPLLTDRGRELTSQIHVGAKVDFQLSQVKLQAVIEDNGQSPQRIQAAGAFRVDFIGFDQKDPRVALASPTLKKL